MSANPQSVSELGRREPLKLEVERTGEPSAATVSARWGQASVHRGINEFSQLSEYDLAQVMKTEASLLHCVANSHSLEVAAVVNFTILTIE